MAVVVNVAAIQIWAGTLLGQRPFGLNWFVHLFVNFYMPTAFDTEGNYVECTWPGYTPFEINPQEWSLLDVREPVGIWQYPLLTWIFDPAAGMQQTVFGYWVEQNSVVLYSEAFTAPFPISPNGGQIPIQLFFTDEQCSS